jgi:hypothetical protein
VIQFAFRHGLILHREPNTPPHKLSCIYSGITRPHVNTAIVTAGRDRQSQLPDTHPQAGTGDASTT